MWLDEFPNASDFKFLGRRLFQHASRCLEVIRWNERLRSPEKPWQPIHPNDIAVSQEALNSGGTPEGLSQPSLQSYSNIHRGNADAGFPLRVT
jgi:hypothetical protein